MRFLFIKEMFLGLRLEKYVNLGLVLKYTVFYSQLYIASLLYERSIKEISVCTLYKPVFVVGIAVIFLLV